MKTKLLFDLQPAQPKRDGSPHGGGEYARRVFSHLIKNNSGRAEVTAIYNPTKPLDPILRHLTETAGVHLVPIDSVKDFQLLLHRAHFDTFYSSAPRKYHDSDLSHLRVIFTIHGLRRIAKEEGLAQLPKPPMLDILFSRLKLLTKPNESPSHKDIDRQLLNVPAAQLEIVVPSEHTKYNLIRTFPELARRNIRVLYSPLPLPSDPGDSSNSVNQLFDRLSVKRRGFFLIVNARQPIKNAHFALSALDNIFSSFPTLQRTVLIVGADEKTCPIDQLRNKDLFQCINYVERSALEHLYREAFALLYPSLDEGFGYPPLECMQHGTPVLCSANSSLAEIYNGAAIFFNPLIIKELEIRLLTILLDQGIWEEYSAKGRRKSREILSRQNKDLDRLVDLILSGP